jgi:ABC-type molybdate transport system permease subunit
MSNADLESIWLTPRLAVTATPLLLLAGAPLAWWLAGWLPAALPAADRER